MNEDDIKKKSERSGVYVAYYSTCNLDDDIYGDYSYTPPQIRIARYSGNEKISDKQMLATFYHELGHCMDYMFDCTTDEAHAQCFSNFMMEFLESKK